MNREVLDWLLDGPPWLRYTVEHQLLDRESVLDSAVGDDSIRKISQRLKDAEVGMPALITRNVSFDETGKAFWDLFFLADVGFTLGTLGLEEETDRTLDSQYPNGTYVFTKEDRPIYYCVSAIVVSSIAGMGYADDPRIRKYIQLILDSQRPDGGWDCGVDEATGKAVQRPYSCPMDNLNILLLLGQYEEYRKNSRFDGAIDLLLDHWNRREEKWRPADFGIGKRFSRLEYPSVKYGILRVLDVLSLFPYATKQDAFRDMLKFVRKKSRDGKYFSEVVVDPYLEFDFAQTDEPSRWITFLVERIEKRSAE